jgi:ABC-2 type transport system permease protein
MSAPTVPLQPPRWWKHLWLLWGLRLTLARGSLGKGVAILPAIVGMVVIGGATFGAFEGTYALFESDAVATDGRLRLFLLLLLSFFASTMTISWPVVTASVDDAAELSRFALFPVPPQRLFLASVLSGLFEPRTLPIWGALSGASLALHDTSEASLLVAVAATGGLALYSVVWGRVGLHLLLNVLRHRRSAEAMGAGLIVLLACAAFVPPPDLSWLRHLNAASPTVDDALLQGAIEFFSLLPSGGWAWAILLSALERPGYGALALGYLLAATVIGYVLAYWLLARFHRRAARALPQRLAETRSVDRYGRRSLIAVLVERELRDCWLNPRTRLTIALPFFLAILLKLVGARALAAEFLGPLADAYLLCGLASYGAFVLGAGFAQNSFGYDAGGAQVLLGAPIEPRDVLRAKNLVHGGMAMGLCLFLMAFYTLYIAPPEWGILVIAFTNAAFQVLLFIALGNVLSVIAPRKFHPSLKRKDRVSGLATSVGLGAASLAVLPGWLLLRATLAGQASALAAVAFALLPAVGWIAWRASGPLAERLLYTRRAELLRAVARE